MVRYADDFVILCPKGRGPVLLERLKQWLAGRKLQLNESKTRLLNARQDSFKFLGFRIRLTKGSRTGKTFPCVEPHPKSCQKLRDNIRALLNHWTLHVPEKEAISALNRKVKGWAAYFHYGNSSRAFNTMQEFIFARVRRWLWRRHKRRRGKYEAYPNELLHQHYNLWKLPMWAAWKHA